MQRIAALDLAAAPVASQPLLTVVQNKLGMIPNLVKTLAHAPAALTAYLQQSEALSGGTLSPALREQIALTVAGANRCDYCASAHTLLGKHAGVDAQEAANNLTGRASDARAQAALIFAKQVIDTRGHVTDAQLQATRSAGFSDEAIVEMVAHVALNIFTNYFNHVAATMIDFPTIRTAA